MEIQGPPGPGGPPGPVGPQGIGLPGPQGESLAVFFLSNKIKGSSWGKTHKRAPCH